MQLVVCKLVVWDKVAHTLEKPTQTRACPARPLLNAYVSIRQHTSACGSTRQHTSAYVSIRQLTSACGSIRQHTSVYARIRQPTAAYGSLHQLALHQLAHSAQTATPLPVLYASIRQHTSAYVSIRQHTSAYVSIRQHKQGANTPALLARPTTTARLEQLRVLEKIWVCMSRLGTPPPSPTHLRALHV